jgi:uncharacterized membrane protein
MRLALDFIKKTAIGGILFLIPVALVVFVLGKLIASIESVARQVADILGLAGIGTIPLAFGIFLALLLVSFLVGLLASTAFGRWTAEWIDGALLSRLPGYGVFRMLAADLTRSLSHLESSPHSRVVWVGGCG